MHHPLLLLHLLAMQMRAALALLLAAPALTRGAPSAPPPKNEPMIMVGLANGGNPGESPPATSFDDPDKLAARGFNAVTILNHELCANFSTVSPLVYPEGSVAASWLDSVREGKQRELASYKARGLQVISKLDMVVLPAALVKLYKAEVTDAAGHLSFSRNKTKELLSVMFDEVVELFPGKKTGPTHPTVILKRIILPRQARDNHRASTQKNDRFIAGIDGFQVRVGEVYLQDAPYHAGEGAVDYHLPFAEQQAQYVELLRFLREELCVKHGKKVCEHGLFEPFL
jgi:hypothetical protein